MQSGRPETIELEAGYLRAVLEATADGLLVVDGSGRVVLANRRFAELWRIPDDLLATRDDQRLIAFAAAQLTDPQSFIEKIRELYDSSEESFDVLRFLDGRIFERFTAPVHDDGSVVGRIWSFRDVTARRKAEWAYREGEERFRSLYNLTPVMLHSIDAEGRMLDVNDYWLQRTGYEREEVIGAESTRFLTPESREFAIRTGIPRLVAEGRLSDMPLSFVAADGEVFDGLLSALAQYDENGSFLRSFGRVVEIGERKKTQAEWRMLEVRMQQAQKLESLGLLAGGIAHDFNNLLVTILGNADLVLEYPSESSSQRPLIEGIVEAAERASELCNQLLAYSGQGRFVIRPVNLGELVHDMGHLLEVTISKGTEIRYEFEDDLPAVEVDVTQLRQIVLNLMTNAAEAIGTKGGVITVSAGRAHCDGAYLAKTVLGEGLEPGDYAYLQVADTGTGMGEETRARIFDPFFTSKATGRGLGMASTIGIVRGHGGTIDVRSKLGRGTSVRVLLPLSDKPAQPLQGSAPEHREWKGEGVVLVVDDEETVRVVARRMLEHAGFRIVTAKDGAEAVETVRKRGPEIRAVLLDRTMPGLDGEATLRELRALDPSIRVVLSSGFARGTADDSVAAVRPTGFIQKPYRSEELVRAVRAAIEAETP